jgi:ribosomal protein S18 acetylase RimI-like enzyme
MIEGDGGPPAQGTVRLATSGDIPAVAALHGVAIDEGFLSTLGDRFLARLYSRIVASPHGFLLVADSHEATEGGRPRVAGFVAGSAAVGRLYREFLWRDGLPAVLSSAPRLMRSLPRVVETLRYGTPDTPARDGTDAGSRTTTTETELLALAVDGAERQRGVGKALVEAFITTARAAGSASARVVVGLANDRAIALYGRAGFSDSERLELHSGTESLVMRVGLHPIPP